MEKRFLILLILLVVFSCESLPTNYSSSSSGETYPVPDKLCALTFDDGPDNVKTPRVISKLTNHGVVATFFVIGQLVNSGTSNLLRQMVSLGYEIGNHSWDWSSLDSATAEIISNKISNTTAAIQQFAGVTPKFFRPPNLATSTLMYDVIDMPFIGGITANDWDSSTTAQQRASNIIRNVRDGVIILLHDVQPDPHPTPEALDIIIPELKKRGYEFVTLSELFERKGVDPNVEYKIWTKVP